MTAQPPEKLGPGDDLQMMQSPDLWPAWPVLPMKRYVEDKQMRQCCASSGVGACDDAPHKSEMETGILIEMMASFEYAWVPGATMFEKVEPTDPRVRRFAKNNLSELQAILVAGWVVD